jgi:hypothetical protein
MRSIELTVWTTHGKAKRSAVFIAKCSPDILPYRNAVLTTYRPTDLESYRTAYMRPNGSSIGITYGDAIRTTVWRAQ